MGTPKKKIRLTNTVKVLLSALHLEERGEVPLSPESLILESWRRYPKEFGLREHEELHPDSHRILCFLSSKYGLVQQGFLSRTIDGQYLLTKEGREMAYQVAEACNIKVGRKPSQPVAPLQNGLDHQANEFLKRALDSSLMFRYRASQTDQITASEAMRFWDLNGQSRGQEIADALALAVHTLEGIETVLKHSNGELILPGGRSFTWKDLEELKGLHNYLTMKYDKILHLLIARKGLGPT